MLPGKLPAEFTVPAVWAAARLLTVWFLVMGYNGNLLAKLGGVYLGYSVSWFGAIIGFVYGFIDGLIAGALIAYLYNKFAN